ncbi:MAG TPA: hypothetical protein VLB74_03375 [Flavobacterium sp.]|uniref:hypothetical protein n=1 Tax=Flavobacterium sp. TaxID=239 RepID=UPI002CF2F1A2|nr:hypothetical protein [Flavobacterium sp.]HSD13665.1 hypothetical protein [Flavobacterium sp.]
MNKKYFLGLVLAGTLPFVSCKNEETAEANPTDKKPVPSVYEIVNGTNIPNKPAQMPQTVTTTQPQPVTSVVPPAPVKVAKGMNPPHGQPGHRCDIAVGAPLNSPPAKPATPPGAATVQKINPSSFTVTPSNATPSGNTGTPNSAVPELLSTSANETAPGMNPPHGQAGHRCDIPVGSPLTKQ